MADGRLLFDTALDAGGFEKGLAGIEALARSGLGGVGKIAGKAARAVKTSLTIGAVAVGGLGIAAAKVGIEFEAQMSRVQAIAGATADELKALNAMALQLGADTAFSAAEAAAGMENLASAGFTVNEIMAAMPGLLDLAAVSGGDVGLAAETAAATIRAFGIEASEAGHVADVFAQAASTTNAEVGDMGEAMKYVAPVAKAMGQEMEMTAAAIGIMSDAGIKGGQAGTTLRGAFSRLAKPTKIMRETMADLGLSFYDAQGNMLPLTDIIAELKSETNGLTQEQKNNALITLFGQESLSGMLALVEAGPEKLQGLTAELKNADGAAQNMAKTMLNNTKGAIDEFIGSLETLGITIYGTSSGPLKSLAETGTGYINTLTEALTSAGETAVTESQRIRDGVIIVNDGFTEAKTGAQLFAEALGGIIADAALKMGEQLPGIIDAAFSVVETFVNTISDNAGKLAESAAVIITALINGVLEYSGQFLELGIELITKIVQGLAETAPGMVTTAKDALTRIIEAVTENLPLLLAAGVDILTAILNGIIEALPQLIESGAQIINQIITTITENLPSIVTAAIQILQAVTNGIIENLPLIIPAIISLINQLIDVIIENFPLILDAGMQILTAIVQGIIENLPAIIPGVLAMISAVADALISNIALLIDLGIQIILALVDGLIQALPWIIAEVPRIINAFADAIYSALPQILALGLKIIVELGKGIINNIPLIIANAGEIFRAILNVFTLSNMFSLGGKLIDFLKQGISNFGPNLMSAVSNMFNGVITTIKNIFTGGTGTGTGLIQNIINGVGQIIPNLITKVSTMGANIMTAIKTALAGALSVGVKLVTDLISGVSSMFFSMTSKAGEIAGAAIKAFTDAFAGAFDIGKNLITGLWNGIKSVKNWIGDKIKGFASGITDSIKGFFGIKSPSRLFEKEIGAMLPPGIGIGIEKATPKLLSNIRSNLNTIKDEFKNGLVADGGLTANAESTVKRINEYDFTVDGTGKKLAFANNINVYSVLDGREVGRGSARFVSAEQSLALKRRG